MAEIIPFPQGKAQTFILYTEEHFCAAKQIIANGLGVWKDEQFGILQVQALGVSWFKDLIEFFTKGVA